MPAGDVDYLVFIYILYSLSQIWLQLSVPSLKTEAYIDMLSSHYLYNLNHEGFPFLEEESRPVTVPCKAYSKAFKKG